MLPMVLPHKFYYFMTNTKEISSRFVRLVGCVRSIDSFFRPIILSSIFNLNTRKIPFFWSRLHIVRHSNWVRCYAYECESVWSDFGIFSSLLFVGIAVNFKEEEKKCAQPVCDSIEWHGSKMSSAHDKHWNKRKGDTDTERGEQRGHFLARWCIFNNLSVFVQYAEYSHNLRSKLVLFSVSYLFGGIQRHWWR